MDVLADTNILVRRINRFDAQHKETRSAPKVLQDQGHRLCVVPQNIIECWSVATRPSDRNGLGLLPGHMQRIADRIEEVFHLLPHTTEVFAEWKRLVFMHSVSGAKVHDAHLVASAVAHGIETVRTFNVDDFRRYTGIRIVHPRDLLP
jgi:predicted nucleic acid-binding protein